MQALRGCACADTDVLTQSKGQQQSHQKVLACLHKRCVLAYDKYTPNFTKSNGARRSGLVGMGEGWAPGRMKGGDRLRTGYALALTHERGWSPAGQEAFHIFSVAVCLRLEVSQYSVQLM